MDNLSMPAKPLPNDAQGKPYRFQDFEDPNLNQATGFTKRERACIDLRIPESGDVELDKLIEKARVQDFAVRMMQGMASGGLYPYTESSRAFDYVGYFDWQMDRGNG